MLLGLITGHYYIMFLQHYCQAYFHGSITLNINIIFDYNTIITLNYYQVFMLILIQMYNVSNYLHVYIEHS